MFGLSNGPTGVSPKDSGVWGKRGGDPSTLLLFYTGTNMKTSKNWERGVNFL